MNNSADPSPAPALSRGLRLLEIISSERELSFKRIQALSGYNVSSMNRLLKTLLATGYLRKNRHGDYELGLRAFTLSRGNSSWNALLEVADPELRGLSETYGVTASLIGYLSDQITVIAKRACHDNVMSRRVGEAKRDYLLSPWGYLYLAELPPAKRPEFYAWARRVHLEDYVNPTDEELENIIQTIQENGYADDHGRVLRRGVRRVAAPIYDPGNALIAALSVGTFMSGVTEDKLRVIAESMKQRAFSITQKLRGEIEE